MKEKATIMGISYTRRPSIGDDRDETGLSLCEGCSFNHYNKGNSGCVSVVRPEIPECEGPFIYVEDTPEAIAEYMARRLS